MAVRQMLDAPSLIRCENVWKVYGAAPLASLPVDQLDDAYLSNHGLVPAVRDVTLDIRKGEIFVIMGLSGSGKSTLVRCMTGLVDITTGNLIVDGDNLRDIGAKRLIEIRRRKISMVFQDFALLPHLTVLDNVAFPLRIQGMKRLRAMRGRWSWLNLSASRVARITFRTNYLVVSSSVSASPAV